MQFTFKADSTGRSHEMRAVDATIAFANGLDTLTNELAPFTGAKLGGKLPEEPWHAQLQELQPGPGSFRAQVRRILELLLTDPKGATKVVVSEGVFIPYSTFDFFDVRYSLAPSTRGLRIIRKFVFEDEHQVYQVGLALLLDDGQAFGAKLCQCQWSPCGKFFFEIKPARGRPRRDYCTTKHMEMAHEQNAPTRMKRHRRKSRKPK